MSDNGDEAPLDERDVESRSFPVPPEPKANGPAAHCPECIGSGQVLLLTSSRACRPAPPQRRLGPAGGEAGWTVEAPDGSVGTHDRLGRLIGLTRRGHGEMGVWLSIDGIRGHATPENDGAESRDGKPMGPEPGAAAFCAECSGTEEPPPCPPPEYRERERIHDSYIWGAASVFR
jgi:hypothetical protein